MKAIAKIICGGVALAWMCSAVAEEPAAGVTGVSPALAAADADVPATAAAEQDIAVPTPPAPRIAVKPYRDKVNRAKVEKRIEDRAARTKKRTAEAERDAAERAAKR